MLPVCIKVTIRLESSNNCTQSKAQTTTKTGEDGETEIIIVFNSEVWNLRV